MSLRDWVVKGEHYLREHGVPEARASAEFLAAEALGIGRATVLSQADRDLSDPQSQRYWAWILERVKRRPLAYIVGHQPFLEYSIKINRDVLIPRPETEELVLICQKALDAVVAPKIVEIGTGSGCIALALAARLPLAMVYATDVSEKALMLAKDNAEALHVSDRIRFVREDMFRDQPVLNGWADLLVSNPPYIPTLDIFTLEPEVQAEPHLALDGGQDGLAAIRAILSLAPKLLKPGGFVALEIGAAQADVVRLLLTAAGMIGVVVIKDAQGLDRFAMARLPPQK